MFRGNPAFQFCLEAIREKLIGDVFLIEADMNHCYGGEIYQDYIAKFKGGLMYNLGCHLIDFVVAALGRPEKINSFLRSAPGYPDEYQNNCMAILEYPHAFAQIYACSKEVCNTPGRSMKIAGTKGTIKFTPQERFDGKSLELELTLPENAGFTLELDTFSENFISEFATVRHNDRYVCGDGSCKITVDGASGNVTIHKG
jgi:predicted dehydrogenase